MLCHAGIARAMREGHTFCPQGEEGEREEAPKDAGGIQQVLSARPPARPLTRPISMPGMRTRKKGMGINWDVQRL